MPADFSPDALSKALKNSGAVLERDAPVSVPSKSEKLFRTLGLPVLIGGQGLDLATTLSGSGNELNPVLGQNPARQALLKGGITAGLAFLLDKMHTKAPKTALTMALIGGAAGAGAGIHNLTLPK